MNWFREMRDSFGWRNEAKSRNSKIENPEAEVGWNVYVDPAMKRKDFIKEFGKVHGRFKYKFLVPGLILARRFFLPKYKHEGLVIKSRYNKEWEVFERAYNYAMTDAAFYMQHQDTRDKGLTWQQTYEKVKNEPRSQVHLKTIKQASIYVCGMDTFYHEFGVFLMHRIAQEMNKEFSGKEYNRIVYNFKTVNEVNWYLLQQMLDQRTGTISATLIKHKQEGLDETQKKSGKVKDRRKART